MLTCAVVASWLWSNTARTNLNRNDPAGFVGNLFAHNTSYHPRHRDSFLSRYNFAHLVGRGVRNLLADAVGNLSGSCFANHFASLNWDSFGFGLADHFADLVRNLSRLLFCYNSCNGARNLFADRLTDHASDCVRNLLHNRLRNIACHLHRAVLCDNTWAIHSTWHLLLDDVRHIDASNSASARHLDACQLEATVAITNPAATNTTGDVLLLRGPIAAIPSDCAICGHRLHHRVAPLLIDCFANRSHHHLATFAFQCLSDRLANNALHGSVDRLGDGTTNVVRFRSVVSF